MDRQVYTFVVLGGDKSIFKSEKQCIVCKEILGIGLMASKKHHCNFCHHAVCADCSSQKAPLPGFPTPKRICTLCYELGMEKHYSDEYSQELQNSLQMREQLMEQISKESLTTQQAEGWRTELETKTKKWKEKYESKMQGYRIRLEEATKENNTLTEQITTLKETLEYETNRLSGRDTQLQELREEVETLKNIPDVKDQVTELKIQLSDLQDRNIRLMKKLESTCKAEGRDDKLFALHLSLKEQIRQVETENEILNSQIQNCKTTVENEGVDVNLLNEMCQRNDVKIQMLRSALDKKPSNIVPFGPAEAVSRNKCKCLVF